MSPSWDDQRAFLAVMEHGSLSAAARELGLTQPTVRARVETLEHQLHTVLFTRSPQGLLPTEHARALHSHARSMDHASQAFFRAASSQPGDVGGIVRLAVAEFTGVEVLPPMLKPLRERHPHLVFELALSNTSANLSEQEADIAIRNFAPTQDTLVARKAGEVTLNLFAHRDYLKARGTPKTPADLVKHELIGPDRSLADLRLAEQKLPRDAFARIGIRTDSHPAQLAAARAGLGIAVVQRPVGLADSRLVAVLPELVVGRLPVWLVTHKNLRHEPRVRVTLDHLLAAFTTFCSQAPRRGRAR